jgi:hypothetical protein
MKRLNQKTACYLAGLLLLLLGGVIGYLVVPHNFQKPKSIVSDMNKDNVFLNFPNSTSLPQNIFDATKSIPGTSVSVAYPKDGFYGVGANPVLTDGHIAVQGDILPNTLGRLSISPTKPNSDTFFSVGIFGAEKGETLKSVVSNIVPPKLQEVGSYITIAGHEYFVYQAISGTNDGGWVGISVGQKEVIDASWSYYLEDGSAAAVTQFRNNDQLFLQILSHVNFK